MDEQLSGNENASTVSSATEANPTSESVSMPSPVTSEQANEPQVTTESQATGKQATVPQVTGEQSSDKKILVAFLLCFALGGLGVHRFYVGKVGTGIVWLLTGGVFGIGALGDLIMIALGAFKDKEGNKIVDWT